MKKEHRIIKTIVAMLVMLFFCALAGAIVTIGKQEGATAKLIMATCILFSGGCVVLFYRIRKIPLAVLGFSKPENGTLKSILFSIPMLFVALSTLCGGINQSAPNIFYANLMLSIAAGFTEEIYLRGIILSIWKRRGIKSGIFVSAFLFAIAHMANAFGGADLGYTLLQIVFAFFIGVSLALIALITKSIWPCMFLHFFQDICAFSGNDISIQREIILLILLIIVLVAYSIFMAKKHHEELCTQ